MAGMPWEDFQSGSSPEESGPWNDDHSVEKPKMTLKGLLENAGKEIVGMAETVKQGAYDIPKSLIKTPIQLAQGKSFGETDLGRDTANIANAAPALPGAIANAVQHPIQTAYENPIATGTALFGGAKGALNLGKSALSATKGLAPKLGGALESAGAKGQNFAAGLREQTVRAMARAGENPGDVGVKIGAQLAKENILGSTPKATFDNVLAAKKAAGQQVGKALADIKTADSKLATHGVIADKALKPLLSSIKEFQGAITGVKQAMGKHFEEVYNFLNNKAAKNDGLITFDEIRKAMKEVGPMTKKGSEETQAVMSELYGTLANVQENMITEIAEATAKPELKTALLNANKKYSLYARIAPDLERAASRESVGKASFFANPVDALKKTVANYASKKLTQAGTKLKGFSIAEQHNNQSVFDKALVRAKHASK